MILTAISKALNCKRRAIMLIVAIETVSSALPSARFALTTVRRDGMRVVKFTLLLAFFLIFQPVSQTAYAGFFDSINPVRIVGNLIGNGLAALSAPSINHAADAFGDKATQVGTTIVAQVNADLAERTKDIDNVIGKNIEKTDDILTKHLADLDQILSTKLGQLDVLGTKQVSLLSSELVGVVRYGAVLIGVAGILLSLVAGLSVTWAGGNWRSLIIPVSAGAVAIVVIVSLASSSLFRPNPLANLDELEAKLMNSYRESTRLGDLDRAKYFTAQISMLKGDEPSAFLADFADLQRDLLARPALFRTSKGSLELSSRMGRLESSWALYKGGQTNLGFLKYEVPATTAMVRWQVATFMKDQISATCDAIESLSAFTAEQGKNNPITAEQATQASPYVWLAWGYVNWSALRAPSETCKGGLSVADALKRIEPTLKVFSDSATQPNPTVQHVVLFNRAASKFYMRASQAYVSFVLTDAELRDPTAPSDKVPLFTSVRNSSLDEIVAAWAEFTSYLDKNPTIQSNDIVYAISGLPIAIVERAKLMKSLPSPYKATRPSFTAESCTSYVNAMRDPAQRNAAPQQAELMSRYVSFLDPQLYTLFCQDQVRADAKLVVFENTFAAMYSRDESHLSERLRIAEGRTIGDGKITADDKLGIQNTAAALSACVVSPESDAHIEFDRGCTEEERSSHPTTAFIDWLAKKPMAYSSASIAGFSMIR